MDTHETHTERETEIRERREPKRTTPDIHCFVATQNVKQETQQHKTEKIEFGAPKKFRQSLEWVMGWFAPD